MRKLIVSCSCEDIVDDAAVHVGQAEIAAAVAVGEALVVEAHQVENCGVQVVDVNFILNGEKAEKPGTQRRHDLRE